MGGPVEVDATGISARESEVLAALGRHLTNAEIAARLFISVRTVESHVSSLLRKLQANDRRALAVIAGKMQADGAGALPSAGRRPRNLPTSLTPFVGRSAERSALATALEHHRLVTAVGPGGVGKTRLALAVAAEISDRFAHGVWYVDLVPVSDGALIAPAIADALGLGDQPGRSDVDTLSSWLTDRHTLLVLDNCEHLLDGVVLLLERLLAASPGLTVLATSRARLLVPFERVFLVPGLSIESGDGVPGDAIHLFTGRAAAGGAVVAVEDLPRVAGVCRALDGVALAIELAAARYSALGLDGLEAGLADRLRVLSGGPRIDDRHRSLRSALDWSYALLDAPSRAVLRRVSVFAEPFSIPAATEMIGGWEPTQAADLAAALAGLVEQSLLVALSRPDGTRYRALETIRQYGAEQLTASGELDEARTRHLTWCLTRAADVQRESRDGGEMWLLAHDEVAAEIRAALAWAMSEPRRREDAYCLALLAADLCFSRGLPGEAQRHYERAGALAPDDAAMARALRFSAGAAESRHFGQQALRLRERAAQAAVRAGDRVGAAVDLARNAELINRVRGLFATLPAEGEAEALILRARELAGDDPAAQARLLCAQAFAAGEDYAAGAEFAERAVTAARRTGDRLAESAALDQLTTVALARGDVRAAAATALRRTQLLTSTPIDAISALEFFDGFRMASECAVAAGDLAAARELAERLSELSFYREEAHIATSRVIVAAVLIGDFPAAIGLGERFRDGWERAGRPRAGNLTRGAYAAATVHGLCGDDDSRTEWLEVVRALETQDLPISRVRFGEFFDALLWLHRGRADLALEVLTTPPEPAFTPHSGTWRPWYAALWAEAAVLTRSGDATDRLRRARVATAGNPIATGIVDRAAALTAAGGGRDVLRAIATVLDDAGCRYQWARTLVMMGGHHRTRGEAAMADMGATPMVWPPESR